MELEFCLDPDEKLVLLSQHLAKVVMQGQAQKLSSKEAANKDLADAVDAVTDDLLRLLRFASNSGLSMLENFNHFDQARNGFVDIDAFTDGLARLGIGVVNNVAESVLERVGGLGTAFITLSDLERFCRANQDVEAFELAGQGRAASRRGVSRQKPFSRQVAEGESAELRAGRVDPFTGEARDVSSPRATLRQRPNVGRLPPLERSVGEFSSLDDHYANEDEYRLSLYPPTSGVSITLDGRTSLSQLVDPGIQAAMGLFGSPLDEGTYKNLGREEITADSAMKLPPWAYDRHKRALRELKNAHARWAEKNEAKLEGLSNVNTLDPSLHLDLSADSLAGTRHMHTDSPIPLPPGIGGFDMPGTMPGSPMSVGGLQMGGALEHDDTRAHSPAPRSTSRGGGSRRKKERSKTPTREGSRSSMRGGGSRPNTGQSAASSNAPSDAEDGDDRDEYLHVINGITMSYRVVKGSGVGIMEGHNRYKQTREDLRMTSILQLREETLAAMEAKARPGAKTIAETLRDLPPDVVISSLTTAQRLRLLESDAGQDLDAPMENPLQAQEEASTRSTGASLHGTDPNASLNFGQFSGYGTGMGSTNGTDGSSLMGGLNNADAEPSFAGEERFVSFTVVVLPDLFMTLDTMEAAYKRLLERYPLARFVFVGLPGCPHTSWPKEVMLTRDIHARAISKLMRHLHKQKRLTMIRGAPVIFVGHGTSVPILSSFASTHMQAIPWLATVAASLVFVSGYLKPSKALKRQFGALKEGMTAVGQHQVSDPFVCSDAGSPLMTLILPNLD
jgi:hypothetical protein